MRAIARHGGGGGGAGTSTGDASGFGGAGSSGGGDGGGAHATTNAVNRIIEALRSPAAIGLALLVASHAAADSVSEEHPGRVIGERRSELVKEGDTLLDIAFRHRVGFEAITRLNPKVDPWIPEAGAVVSLPTRTLVPRVEEEGLVINVPEMRLFDFTGEGEPTVIAAAVGDADDPTPTGDFKIRDKRVDPVWTVPKSIREEKPGLPEQVPPGPANPLGSRWMRIGTTSCGIHGTNARWSIGRAATHGCVRLYEDEVLNLFERVPEGTRLQIVYQPYKWGRDGTTLLFEAHPDRYHRIPNPLVSALEPMRDLGLLDRLDLERVWQAIDESRGIPIAVGTLPALETP